MQRSFWHLAQQVQLRLEWVKCLRKMRDVQSRRWFDKYKNGRNSWESVEAQTIAINWKDVDTASKQDEKKESIIILLLQLVSSKIRINGIISRRGGERRVEGEARNCSTLDYDKVLEGKDVSMSQLTNRIDQVAADMVAEIKWNLSFDT